MPPDWEDWLTGVFLYATLSPEEKVRAVDVAHALLARKRFEGCGGLRITERMKVVIAVQAAIPVLGHVSDTYPVAGTILLYPDTFVTGPVDYGPDGPYVDGDTPASGEAWQSGQVVLSWKDVEMQSYGREVGASVVIHEFAHRLDMTSGFADGFPLLPRDITRARWCTVMDEAYEEHLEAVGAEKETVFDPYGAESPAEFFAVASEAFFLQGDRLSSRHHDVYALFRDFYRQDPAGRLSRFDPEETEDGLPTDPGARDIAIHLGLKRHSCGGWFAETPRHEPAPARRPRREGRARRRAGYTSLVLLLVPGRRTMRRRVPREEFWMHQGGDDVALTICREGQSDEHLLLGIAHEAVPQVIVSAGSWLWFEVPEGEESHAFLGCVVSRSSTFLIEGP